MVVLFATAGASAIATIIGGVANILAALNDLVIQWWNMMGLLEDAYEAKIGEDYKLRDIMIKQAVEAANAKIDEYN